MADVLQTPSPGFGERSPSADGASEDETFRSGSATDPALRTSDRGRLPDTLARRVVIEQVRPQIDAGRFPIKRTIGESVIVQASIFADGHDVIAAVLRDRHGVEGEQGWRETPMISVAPGTDEWTARFDVGEPGWHEYTIVGWVDRFRTWRHGLEVKARAGQDVGVELLEGAQIVREAAARAEQIGSGVADSRWLLTRAGGLDDATIEARVTIALDQRLAALMDVYADRSRATSSPTLRVWVDRERARFGAWYEMFPRSAGPDPLRSATFQEAAADLTRVAALGFDVVYLPPIHPIGRQFRKGPNNRLTSGPGDPGSPWAIGSEEGGHTAVEPGLGGLSDFEAFRSAAERLGLEVALDLAWQCSPDHPWVREHPEWFRHRPDGTIKYAENPPKKYQDIYPFDFECGEWRALWQALLDVTRFWTDRGVRIFRVDNPHTKTFGFWEWLIHEVQAVHPDAIFLAEAFTRPALMRRLAKAGFTQSYTYFTWRNSKTELEDYLTELTRSELREYMRPNFFANTPDILHAYLQEGGKPAFEARLILAATLAASYGIYSGFELCENRAVPGSEEYADSEKYQFRPRDWTRPGIQELVARVNRIRRAHPALHFDSRLRFHETDNPQLIAYSKSSPDGDDVVMTIVNLDPRHMQHGTVAVPLDLRRSLGAGPDDGYVAQDLLDGTTYTWRGERNYVRLDPEARQGHILWLPTLRS